MPHTRLLSPVIASMVLAMPICSAAEHPWQSIIYSPLDCPWGADKQMWPSLRPGRDALQFSLGLHWGNYRKPGFDPSKIPHPKEGEITIRFHCGAREALTPKVEFTPLHVKMQLRGTSSSGISVSIPFQENRLEEAWIEIRIPGQTYWLEVPYGFTRPHSAPLSPAQRSPSEPKKPEGIGGDTETTNVRTYKFVAYDLGTVQNGWKASVKLWNHSDANGEITLYKDSDAGLDSWPLDSPVTKMSFAQPDGYLTKSARMVIARHRDGLRRTDSFDFSRNPDESGRFWGKLIVEIDDKNYEISVPSSMFVYRHGSVGRLTRQTDRSSAPTIRR